MSPKIQAAIDAIQAAVREDPVAFVSVATSTLSESEVEMLGRIMLDKMAERFYVMCRRTGRVDALTEIAQKALRIAQGYEALGETDLCAAFAKFAGKVADMSVEQLKVVKVETESIKADIPKPPTDGKLN